MAIESVDSLKKGQTVRFKTLSTHDNVLWVGKIIAVCEYIVARKFQDIDTYYQDVLKVQPDMGSKETLTYIVLLVSENGATATERVFAIEWIDKASLEIIVENTYVDIRIYDINRTKANDAVLALSSMGYVSEITAVSS